MFVSTQLMVSSVSFLFELFSPVVVARKHTVMLEVNTCKGGGQCSETTYILHQCMLSGFYFVANSIGSGMVLPYPWLHVTNPITNTDTDQLFSHNHSLVFDIPINISYIQGHASSQHPTFSYMTRARPSMHK